MDKQLLKKLMIGDFNWKRMLKSFLFIYAFFAVYVYFRADSMIFLPQPASYENDANIKQITSGDNQKISIMYLQNPQAKYTIIYAHGNAEDLGDIQSHLQRIRNLGFNVLAYDYRGYGTSTGRPTENNVYEDIDAVYNYLNQILKVPSQQIIIFGRSVGGGSAVDLASRKPVAGLIVESTFTSAFRVVVTIPILPFDKFNNLDKIKKIKCPVLVIHGRLDQVIPFDHSEKLFAAISSPKLSFWVDNANHDDVADVAGKSYDQILLQFADLVSKSSN